MPIHQTAGGLSHVQMRRHPGRLFYCLLASPHRSVLGLGLGLVLGLGLGLVLTPEPGCGRDVVR